MVRCPPKRGAPLGTGDSHKEGCNWSRFLPGHRWVTWLNWPPHGLFLPRSPLVGLTCGRAQSSLKAGTVYLHFPKTRGPTCHRPAMSACWTLTAQKLMSECYCPLGSKTWNVTEESRIPGQLAFSVEAPAGQRRQRGPCPYSWPLTSIGIRGTDPAVKNEHMISDSPGFN